MRLPLADTVAFLHANSIFKNGGELCDVGTLIVDLACLVGKCLLFKRVT